MEVEPDVTDARYEKESAMGRINAEWHRAHVMPKSPTDAERAKWHYEHARHCGCRAPTPAIRALLIAHGYDADATVLRRANRL